MAKGATMIKVVSILLIIFSVISLILLIVASAFVGAMAGGANEIALEAEAAITSEQVTQAAGTLGGYIVVSVIMVIIELVAGIVGLVFAKKPEKAIVLIVFGVILIILQIVSVVMNKKFDLSVIVGFILPILYLVGAILNKNGSGEVPPAAPTDVPPAQ